MFFNYSLSARLLLYVYCLWFSHAVVPHTHSAPNFHSHSLYPLAPHQSFWDYFTCLISRIQHIPTEGHQHFKHVAPKLKSIQAQNYEASKGWFLLPYQAQPILTVRSAFSFENLKQETSEFFLTVNYYRGPPAHRS